MAIDGILKNIAQESSWTKSIVHTKVIHPFLLKMHGCTPLRQKYSNEGGWKWMVKSRRSILNIEYFSQKIHTSPITSFPVVLIFEN